ncbi:MAG: tetratricopeptide (TPR) repeat protein [Lentimonas sp.]|jgi:tetratricopeptide (TPR) repeat protein
MPKATIKLICLILLPLTCIWLTGCTSAQEKKNQQIEEAANLRAQGDNSAALAILEELTETYPNDTVILQHIGQIYGEQGDATLAAFFLEQAYKLAPDDIELLYQTYLAVKKAQQPTGELLEKLADRDPDAMPSSSWLELGQHLQTQKKTQPALDAYLKGVNPDEATPPASTAVAIGQLFIALDNLPQAQHWFNMATESDSPDSLTALFGLLEIQLRNKNWEGAAAVLVRLDKQFPGAVDASEWASARSELGDWSKAQAEMKTTLATKQPATSRTIPYAPAYAAEFVNNESSGKTAIIEDLENAEAMANRPAIKVASEASGKAPFSSEVEAFAYAPAVETAPISFNPEITIQPADPDARLTVTYDEADIGGPANYTTRSTLAQNSSAATAGPTVTVSSPRASAPAMSLPEILEQATRAESERDYSSAISSYWQALGLANEQAELWHLLSRAYLIDGQLKNAETTSLEAIRLAPKEVSYTLDYLRVAQRSKKASEFLSELENAYDRFPLSPEITLSLARAFERISRNNSAARTLYGRFIEIAPTHPLRGEADSALDRLR